MNCRTGRCKTILFVFVLLALAIVATPAFAGNCLEDVFPTLGQCVANDVVIASVTNTRNLDGTPITTCNVGSRISFIATYTVTTNSKSSRSNVGLYFATDNQAGDGKKTGGARTGSCSDNIIPPGAKSTHSLNVFCTGDKTPYSFCTGAGTGTSTAFFGTDAPLELDPSPDNCGDSNSSSTQHVDVIVQNVLCEPISATDSRLRLPNCTSWQVPGQTINCVSPSPTYPWVSAAVPGSPPKCNCDVLAVPIIVQHASISVTKTPNPTSLSGTDGGPIDYTVVVTNTSNLGGVTINQLCDDKYGNIKTAVTNPAQNACAAGTLCSSPNNVAGSTCATNITCPLPATLAAPNDSVTCTFTGNVPEESTTTDTVTANGVDSNVPPNAISGTASATVTAGDAPAAAQTTKTLVGAQAACYTIRYGVKVHNSSGSTTDENESLTAFDDSAFSSITSTHGDNHTNNSVIGTTCGVAVGSPGLGTLSGTTASASNGGALPYSLTVSGTDYQCQFDGVVCGNVGSITKPDQTQCIGISHTNTVTPTLLDDSVEGHVVSNTGGTLVVDECLSEFSQ
jgi:hypothetical protein